MLLIAVDQFRYDYLTRFRKDFTGGFDRLLTQGAVFTDANLEHYPTVTAIGHATMLTGATPSVSGIIGNDWFDRETAAQVQSITDPTRQADRRAERGDGVAAAAARQHGGRRDQARLGSGERAPRTPRRSSACR